MSAGAVRAPLIIPLRIPTGEHPKSQIDTNTKLEIISETPNTTIYFTINGSRPIVKKSDKDLLNFGTHKFRNPFTLPMGTQTIRALAFLPETGCESNVVTKRFEVSKATSVTESGKATSRDDYAFLDDLKTIEYHRKRASKAILDLPERDNSVHRSTEKNSDKPTRLGVDSKSSDEYNSPKGCEDFTAAGDSGQLAEKVDKTTSHTDSITDAPSFKHALFDCSSQLSRLQQRTDLLHCPNCFNPRSPNQSQKYCVHCGRDLPVLPTCAAAPLAAIRLGPCPVCHSKVPLNLPVCLICESPLKPPENPGRRPHEYRVCTICGTVNPLGTVSCWTCEGRLATGMENLILHSTAEAHHIGPPPSPPTTKPEFTNANDIYLPCPHCRRENDPGARYCDWCGLETSRPRVLEPFSSGPHTGTYAGSYGQQRVLPCFEPTLACSQCGSANLRHAQFCAFCGFQLPPPDRQSVWSTPASQMSDVTIVANSFRNWVAPGRHVVVSNASTQTVGLFYPSAADMRRRDSCLRANLSTDAQLHDRTPLLTAVSPGRGFWRKQLDHIVGHLKVYTSNNPDFQAVIGEPRLGKLVAAGLHASHGQATVMLTYTLPHSTSSSSPRQSHMTVSNNLRPPSCSKSRKLVSSKCRSVSERWSIPSNGSSSIGTPRTTRYGRGHSPENARSESQCEPHLARTYSPDSEDCTKTSGTRNDDHSTPVMNTVRTRPPSGNRTGGSARRKSSKRATFHQDNAGAATLDHSQLTTADHSLLRLLSQPGEVDQEKIRQAIGEGANPNCLDSDGNTPLVVAVHHGKAEAIPPLVEAGAEVNAAGPLNGNTALHEAVSRGFDGGAALVEVLLRCGANPNICNKRQESSRVLAMRSNCEATIRLLESPTTEAQPSIPEHATAADSS